MCKTAFFFFACWIMVIWNPISASKKKTKLMVSHNYEGLSDRTLFCGAGRMESEPELLHTDRH